MAKTKTKKAKGKKTGRPKTDPKKHSKVLSVSFSAAHLQWMGKQGKPRSKLIRELIDRAINKQKK